MAGVEGHSMAKYDDDEMPELEPLNKQEEGEEDEREDDPIVEVESKAEDAYGHTQFNKIASELTFAYLASKPEVKGFRRIKDSVYEVRFVNGDGDFIRRKTD